MNTADFLQLVVPAGVRYIVKVKPHPVHNGFTTDAAAAAAALRLAAKHDVYHACAAYREPFMLGVNGKEYRSDANFLTAKSFWLDLDVEANNPLKYPTQDAALAGLALWCKSNAIPVPTLFVDSGYGIHAYWVMTEALTLGVWKNCAELLKACLTHGNVLQDVTRTADPKSILRPPGTFNHKRGEAKPVEVIGKVRKVHAPRDFMATLLAYQEQHDVQTAEPVRAPQRVGKTAINADLASPVDYPDVSAHKVAENCLQIAAIRDVKGNVPEPLWRGMLGVVKFCVEGVTLAQEWSSGHADYAAGDTAAKFERYDAAPTTCNYFKAQNPRGCDGCPHAVNSPIRLGELPPPHIDAPPDTVTLTTVGNEEVPFVPPKFPAEMLDYYRWNGKELEAMIRRKKVVKGKETVVETWEAFYENRMLGSRYYARDKQYYISMATEHRGAWREIEIPCALIGGGGVKLHEHIGRQLVVALPKMKEQMEGFLASWHRQLKRDADEVLQYQQFGWTADHEFVYGERLYKPDGTIGTVLIGGDALSYAPALRPHGNLDRWKALIDQAYNYAGQEQYQTMLCVGFGAPLLSLLRNYNGAVLHAMTPETAEGKTTVGKAALSIWGHPERMFRTLTQTSDKALFKQIGCFNNMPFLIDEVTNVKGGDVSKLLYSISDGAERVVLNQDGTIRATALPWTTLVLTTGNRSLVASVGASKINAEAEIARIVEFKFKHVSQLSKPQAMALFEELSQHWALAGDVYMRYVVAHREEVLALLHKVQTRLDTAARMDRKERFWSATLACILTGATIAKALGLIQFDTKAMMVWMVQQVVQMRRALRENTADYGDAWSMMLNEYSRQIVVTDTWGDRRNNNSPVEVKFTVNGPVVGRTVTSDNATYLSQAVMRQWCNDHQVDYSGMVDHAVGSGWSDPKVMQVSLGKGTILSTSACKCFKLHIDKLSESDIVTPVSPVTLVVSNP